jgi:uncharacterized membrane protein YczE
VLLESRLGLSPWDVLHQGIAKHSPFSFGVATIVVGVVVLAVAWLLGAKVGFGTVANAVLIGVFIDALLRIDAVTNLAHTALVVRMGLVAAGIWLIGAGSAFYIGAALGAGPRDSLMLVLSRRTEIRIGAVRTVIELTALIAGFALGGKVGLGTLAFAVLIGPSVETSFFLLERSPLGEPPRAPVPSVEA